MEHYMKPERLGIDPMQLMLIKLTNIGFELSSIFSNSSLQAMPEAVVNLAHKQ